MAIYYCPLCNKRFSVDNIEQAGDVISCSMCGSTIHTKQLVEYSQKMHDTVSEETEPISQSAEHAYNSNANPATNSKEDTPFTIQKKQLEELTSIKNMLKFFTILTIINLVSSLILALIAFS